MKEPWCLAASNADAPAREIVNLYAKRWTIEPSFRDTKDLRFGMGLAAVRIGEPQRRDRLLLLNAFAVLLLTLLSEAGEALGMDRHLKPNFRTLGPAGGGKARKRWGFGARFGNVVLNYDLSGR
jgi:Transposase DDE domain